MNSMSTPEKYVDIGTNGRLFPSWVLSNFREYKLPKVIVDKTKDPCAKIGTVLSLKKYQLFLADYLGYGGPNRNILVYHGLGSGKTASAINIYNMLYNHTPGWNVFILIKAALRNTPWMEDLDKWLTSDEKPYRLSNIVFVHYDAPNADKQFIDAVRASDTSKKPLYIFDEVHNFIRNVYGNITSGTGRRAQVIYDHIIQDQKDNPYTRVVCLSGTPAVNSPFELAILFNLLRPGSFPTKENLFNKHYVSNSYHRVISPKAKNMFQRRIIGLVSYYAGSSPDTFPSKTVNHFRLKMSDYQASIYSVLRHKEEQLKSGPGRKGIYRAYTRQGCNFVFPGISQVINGESRPRPGKYGISDKQERKLLKGFNEEGEEDNVKKYLAELEVFKRAFIKHLDNLRSQDEKSGKNIMDDVGKLTKTKDAEALSEKLLGLLQDESASLELKELIRCGIKIITCCVIQTFYHDEASIIYSNIVRMEGLTMVAIYLSRLGFRKYNTGNLARNNRDDHKTYAEFHGGVSEQDRNKVLEEIRKPRNAYGKYIKILLLSKAGTEGISLSNMRSVNLLDPHWNTSQEDQTAARAIRYCSLGDLPMELRHVLVNHYYAIVPDGSVKTADEIISENARLKSISIKSFTDAVKEVAVDCELNKEHNSLISDVRCFKFSQQSLFDTHIGPAYKQDFYDDIQMNNGSNDIKSETVRIRAIEVSAVPKLADGSYGLPKKYWYHPEKGVLYDLELKFPIGKVALRDGVPEMVGKTTFVIGYMIPIPVVK